ncbi:transposon Tf2-9 polyprotein [Nephila pilipes]|uniref:Transposon Tf2-9 polyprotein n=1 Tax=Nephila pilipes TaxID=299642 RepID=A0A8X6P336_NEPPI|nr:transposon Tf2-9 polyprotein [Nephila pilipes]
MNSKSLVENPTQLCFFRPELFPVYVLLGIGGFPNEPYHITLKDNSVPVIHPPRRVPQALQPKLKSTLNNLEKEGIVSKVNKPTDWVQSLVIVEKPNGNLRLCLDPRDLNKVIKREHYQILYTDNIISRLEDHIKAIVAMPKPKSKTEVRDYWACASDEIVIQCDSSKDGLGSFLIQKGQPLSFVSRNLTNSEKNYAQIKKELLAIVFSFEKYHNFVYGCKVAIQRDHKSLMAIVKKPMHKISSRMQRMILKLLKYDFELNYVPGNQMFLADTLLRAFPINETVRDDPEMLNIVHTVSKHLPMNEKRLAQFKKETELNTELKIVVKYSKRAGLNLTKVQTIV